MDAFNDFANGLTGAPRRPEQMARENALQRAYEFCRGCAPY
jgi:hypothetical protein